MLFVSKQHGDRKGMMVINTADIDELVTLLSDRETDVQWRAARALGEYGEAALDPLLKKLYADDINVRILSIWALGNSGDSRAAEHLERLMHDENFLIAMASEGAISRLSRKI
jgi:HEAT repeat protein